MIKKWFEVILEEMIAAMIGLRKCDKEGLGSMEGHLNLLHKCGDELPAGYKQQMLESCGEELPKLLRENGEQGLFLATCYLFNQWRKELKGSKGLGHRSPDTPSRPRLVEAPRTVAFISPSDTKLKLQVPEAS